MTNRDLFLALNYARPEYLECSETAGRQPKRISVRVLLVAAVLAALSCTVLGGVLLTNRIEQAQALQTNRPAVTTDLGGTVQVSEGMAEVYLALSMEEVRPAQIEDFYVPMFFDENWQMDKQVRPTHQQNREVYPDTRLRWKNEDGCYAEFTQFVVDASIAADCAEYPFDCVSTGYNETCHMETVQLGQYSLFCVTVPPSSTESEGQTLYHDGLRKFYWSDGLYLFALEVSYEVSDETVCRALDSICVVTDITDYEQVVYMDPEPTVYATQMAVLVPAELSDDWQQRYGYLAPDGCYNFAWNPAADSGIPATLELAQVLTDSQTGLIRDWETSTDDVQKYTYTLQDWQVTVYCRAHKLEAFWHAGETDYVLTVRGAGEEALDGVLTFIENLQWTNTPEDWLTE